MSGKSLPRWLGVSAPAQPSVTLFGQTYPLPAMVGERFRQLRRRIEVRSRAIQEGIQRPARWFGLGRAAAPVDSEQRFHELEGLVQDYDALIQALRDGMDEYRLFFARLALGVRLALDAKGQEMRGLELERQASYREAVAQGDTALRRLAVEDEERLLHGARLLGQAALLLLRKIALCQEGLDRLAQDQALQAQVLAQLTGRLDSHRRAYQRRQRIDRVLREVAEMARVALEFEHYVRAQLGPLQDLLDEGVRVESALRGAAADIEILARGLAREGMPAWPEADGLDAPDRQFLDCLMAARLGRDRLPELWRRLEQRDGLAEALDLELAARTVGGGGVLPALDNIGSLVELRLGPLGTGREALWRGPVAPGTDAAAIPSFKPDPAPSAGFWRKLAARPVRDPAGAFVRVPAGSFLMGSGVYADEQPIHEVHIARPFELGRHPVTQAQWRAVMDGNPSYFQGDLARPVDSVSWEDVRLFIARLNERAGGLLYRLPTEAEWEYAARAGCPAAYGFGEDVGRLHRHAWYALNAGGRTHPVQRRAPNAWGLYDMHGNIWEWVWDWYGEDYYAASPRHDPQGPADGLHRTLRGGGWDSSAGDCRAASRNIELPGQGSRSVGFRLLRKLG